MNIVALVSTSVILTAVVSAFAQDLPTATYDGVGTADSGKTEGIRLVVESVNGGIVKGTASRFRKGKKQACSGEFPVEGTVKDGNLTVKATERGGGSGDCNFKLNAKIMGEKLVGTWNNDRPIELSR